MKKLIVCLVLLAAVSSCKKTDKEGDVKPNKEVNKEDKKDVDVRTDCDVLGRIEGSTPEEKATYLFEHFEEFCYPALRSCIENNHNIGFKRYDDAIKLYRNTYPNEKPDYYAVKWSVFDTEIKNFERRISYNCYADYLSFVFNADGTYRYQFTNRYSSSVPSYSVPLLNGINEKFQLDPDDWFVFSKGRVLVTLGKKGTAVYKDIIVFTVKGNYYDISDDPGKGMMKGITPSPI